MINSYDIETFVDEKSLFITPYCICFIVKNNKFVIYYKENFNLIQKSLEIIFNEISEKELLYIYIHKLDFDGLLIISHLVQQVFFKFNMFTRENNIYYICIEELDKKKMVMFKCSKKILPSSLKNIAESFNLPPKLPFPYGFSKKENLFYNGKIPNSSYFNSLKDWENLNSHLKIFDFKKWSIAYCLRDVLITQNFIKIIEKIIKVFQIKLDNIFSTPSLSLKIFEKHFNKNRIKIKQDPILDKIIRPSYYGGRCEVYGNNYQGGFIVHFDFSGMYAQCMLEKYAFGSYKIIKENCDVSVPGYYSIDFKSNNLKLPVLPHHKLENNKLMFTNGEMSNIYWFEEILLFLKMVWFIKKINYGIVFNNYDFVFNEFVDYFTAIKKFGNDYKTFGKLIINSFYGRTGMDDFPYHSFFIKTEDLDYHHKKYNVTQVKILNDVCFITIEIDHKTIKDFKIEKRNKSNVSIASAITSKARIKLYNAQQDVINNGGRILYSDTDSIFAVYEINPINKKHGEVFWDGSKNDTIIKKAVFVAPKTYGLVYDDSTSIIKIKGISAININFNDFERMFYANDEKIILDNQLTIFKKDFSLKNKILDKDIFLNNYDKRKFINKKLETEPFLFLNYSYI